MNIRKLLSFFGLINFLICFSLFGKKAENLSIKLEIERAIEKGINWLNREQNRTSGHWGDSNYPALTGLALRANLGAPNSDFQIKGKQSTCRWILIHFIQGAIRWRNLWKRPSVLQHLHLYDGFNAGEASGV